MQSNNVLDFSWFLRQFYYRTGNKLIFCGLITNIFSYTVPIYVMNVYDKVVPSGYDSLLYVLVFIAISLCLIFYLFSSFADFQVNNEFTMVMFDAQDLITKKIPNVKINRKDPDHDEYLFLQAKVSISNIINNMPNVKLLALVDLPFSILIIFFIFYLGGALGYLSLAVFIIIAAVNLYSQKHVRQFVDSLLFYTAKSSQIHTEICQKQTQIRLYNLGDYFFKQHKRYQIFINGAKYRSIQAQVDNFSSLVSMLATVFLIAIGASKIQNGNLLVGNLVAISIFSGRLFSTARLSRVLYNIYMLKSCFDKLDRFSKQNIENQQNPRALKKVDSIACENLTFSFVKDHPILAGVNLTLNQDLVYIQGDGSSGKTTLFNNLAKIRIPESGKVLVNGLDSSNFNESDIRKKIHFCCSEQAFFSGTIADNLFLCDKTIGSELLDEVLELLDLKSRMLRSNIRLNQVLGGQLKLPFSFSVMQLLKICRTLISNADIFVFDDPFVGLDAKTVKHVEKALVDFCRKYGKGLCIISSKPAALKFDRSFVLQDGIVSSV